MWTEITRPKYEPKGQRYASDVTDGETQRSYNVSQATISRLAA
jgi:hypothetical protein